MITLTLLGQTRDEKERAIAEQIAEATKARNKQMELSQKTREEAIARLRASQETQSQQRDLTMQEKIAARQRELETVRYRPETWEPAKTPARIEITVTPTPEMVNTQQATPRHIELNRPTATPITTTKNLTPVVLPTIEHRGTFSVARPTQRTFTPIATERPKPVYYMKDSNVPMTAIPPGYVAMWQNGTRILVRPEERASLEAKTLRTYIINGQRVQLTQDEYQRFLQASSIASQQNRILQREREERLRAEREIAKANREFERGAAIGKTPLFREYQRQMAYQAR